MTTALIMFSIALFIPALLGIVTQSAGVFGFGMLAGMLYLGASDSNRLEKICLDKKIAAVGGCNRYGDCRVLNDDGTDGIASMPLVGRVSNECHTIKHEIWWDNR